MFNQKIAVTAASGRLAQAIIKQLKKEVPSSQIIGIARTPEKAKNLDIEIRKGDYNSKSDFQQALKGIEALLIVSGSDYPDKRIQQHRNIIEAAVECGVKKIVYTSVIGPSDGNNAFSLVAASNHKTEEDIKNSGLQWAIGRNGVYIEPDLEYINTYIAEGGIVNCAADGKCGYTSRTELACACAKLLTDDSLLGKTYKLTGTPISQSELATAINKSYGTNLAFKSLSSEEYLKRRVEALGELIGPIIGGIYDGIRNHKYDTESDFQMVTQREHKTVDEMILEFKGTR